MPNVEGCTHTNPSLRTVYGNPDVLKCFSVRNEVFGVFPVRSVKINNNDGNPFCDNTECYYNSLDASNK